MGIRVREYNIRLGNLETRLPFEFGVVTMTEVPHCILELTCRVDEEEVVGRAADHFPPKWLTKDPEQSLADEARNIHTVVRRACEHAEDVRGESVFACWQKAYSAQRDWAKTTSYPPLLWAFGVTFIERALIDAYCRGRDISFNEAVREGHLGIQLGHIYPELGGVDPVMGLPDASSNLIDVRHTVGYDAPLTGEVNGLNDGLPVTLEENVEYYGVNKFKIKVAGNPKEDTERVRDVCRLLDSICEDFAVTLDANEQYKSVEALRALIERLRLEASIRHFDERLLFVEQPFSRDVALSPETGEGLSTWADCPPIIIDESDGELDSCQRALDLGYAGTSHKNCKGVFKSIANACLIERRRGQDPDRSYILSAEDLTTTGPISLQQDLAVAGVLGLSHVERNGHHFFRGLEAFGENIQSATHEAHTDLFRGHEEGFTTLDIVEGKISLSGVLDAPFGYRISDEVLHDFLQEREGEEWSPPV